MQTKRLEKYESLIHNVLNQYLIIEGKNLIKNNFVTIMGVKVSSNMSLAKVYLSFLKEKTQDENFKIIEKNKTKIRGFLGNKIRHQVRKIPEIELILDTTEQKASRLEQIIDELKIPKVKKK